MGTAATANSPVDQNDILYISICIRNEHHVNISHSSWASRPTEALSGERAEYVLYDHQEDPWNASSIMPGDTGSVFLGS